MLPTDDLNNPFHFLNQRLGDRQSQTSSTEPPDCGFILLFERFEDIVQCVTRDTDAIIFNNNAHDVSAHVFKAQVNFAVVVLTTGKLDCVAHDIVDDLAKPGNI